jgi:uncharacterized membrane protein
VLRRVSLFFLPLLLAAAYLAAVWSVFPPAASSIILGAMVLYLVSPLGVEFVVPGAVLALRTSAEIADPVPAIVAAVLSVVLVDVFTALFLLWNFDLAERVPFLGGFIRKTEEKCHRVIERRKWGEGVTLAALTAYVALPVQMSGGLVGSIFGRLLGIRPVKVFAAVSAGSLLGAVPFGVASALIPEAQLQGFVDWVRSLSVTQVLGILVLATFIVAIVWLYRRGRANGGS